MPPMAVPIPGIKLPIKLPIILPPVEANDFLPFYLKDVLKSFLL
jgi:hypothetical protein